MAMAGRLFAVHDSNRESVRLEAAPDSVSSPEILLAASRAQVLKSDGASWTPEMSLAQADATGQVNLVPASVRPAGESQDTGTGLTSTDLVQPSDRSQTAVGEDSAHHSPDLNWFLNTRIRAVLPRVRGRLLDVGCGVNELVRRYGNGLGVQRVTDTSETEKFDTISLVAVLNYIPEVERESVLRECYKRLNKYGRLIITCRTLYKGLAPRSIIPLVEAVNFRLVYSRSFMIGMNRIYVFGKEENESSPDKSMQHI